ncbi:MmcQ/YjbR family DNA-binding protein [Thalassococcus sp. CAU 1522]|uniref:MmcQ/YjbR family DNA-binding protein n=1 Tax=Thalassococcus arenae TaxID=2851652 RepID=A0ABS6NB48_9RHOB|nr:MmcQ/YjbR family DNA-binding protein [Thalassococcus arenae]MBV2361235.1 MmcQ/YjbR family DNA-binding protein [Thalassococcus arenae]
MSRDTVNAICAALPGAECSDPWGGGHDAWKVGGKMFVCIGAVQKGVSVKTPSIEDAALLIDMGRAARAPYFHRSWVLIDDDAVPEDELRDRIETSYRIVAGNLSRKKQRELGLP